MDWINMIVPGIAGFLGISIGGTLLKFFIFPKITKKQEQAGADQEGAKADGLNLGNIKEVMELQGKTLVETTKQRDSLAIENYDLKSKMRGYDYEIENIKRQLSGVQNTLSSEISRRIYAEQHICLNLPCTSRIPTIGTFISKADEKKNG